MHFHSLVARKKHDVSKEDYAKFTLFGLFRVLFSFASDFKDLGFVPVIF